MGGFFSVWDTQTRNIVNTYAWLDDALAVVANLVAAFGADYADALELSWTSDDDAEHRVIASGFTLLVMARQTSPESAAAAS